MVVVKSAIFVLLVGCVVFQQADAFLRRGRRRRRRCTPTACQVSQWSSWSSCSAFGCGQQGSEQRSRTVVSSPSCGGAACPGLIETRLCYSSTPVDCQLSSWSEWSVCSTPCGVSGTQSCDRHRITTEQCGGTCTSTFQKTRACPELSCLNEGILNDNTCFCKDGYGGVCCEKSKYLLVICIFKHLKPANIFDLATWRLLVLGVRTKIVSLVAFHLSQDHDERDQQETKEVNACKNFPLNSTGRAHVITNIT